MKFRSGLALIFLLFIIGVISAPVGATEKHATKHIRHLYVGQVLSIKTPVKLQIEFDYGDPSLGTLNNSTWIDWLKITTLSSTIPNSCKGQGPWGWNGATRVHKGSFSDEYAPKWANKDGYVDLYVIHGRVSGWDKRGLSWRRVTGTIRLAQANPAYTDSHLVDHPAYHCDVTYHWSAIRRG